MNLKVNPKAKALIFDLDGTLSDSLPIHVATWNEVGRFFGFTFDPKIVYELTGRPTIEFARRIIEDFNLDADPQEIVKMKQDTFHNSKEFMKPVEEVIQIAKEFHGKLPMAVGTGASRRSADVQLKTLGIYDLFDAIITADDVTRHKPEPETFLRCAQLMKVEPEFCQVFEDGQLGIVAAQIAGMIVTDVRLFINYGNWDKQQ